MQVRFCKDTYENCIKKNPVFPDGVIIFITDLPWHKSWFGLKPTRVKLGDGKTSFNKLKFL